MPVKISTRVPAVSLAERLAAPRSRGVVLDWLGQAGFIITAGPVRLMIDPYLSDSLAQKYRGTPLPHERIMPAPVVVSELGSLDLVLVTHHHTDHMDPGTLAPLAAAQPGLRFVVPRASLAEAESRIAVGPERLIDLDAGERIEPLPGVSISAMRAAHETIERDEAGHHRFLGYALDLPLGPGRRVTVVHSGDTVPFEGQEEELAALEPDILLLPVNGRSAELKARGVPGNMTLEEAVDLAVSLRVLALVAHHHGLFAFNTRPLDDIQAKAAEPGLPVHLIAAQPGLEVRLRA